MSGRPPPANLPGRGTLSPGRPPPANLPARGVPPSAASLQGRPPTSIPQHSGEHVSGRGPFSRPRGPPRGYPNAYNGLRPRGPPPRPAQINLTEKELREIETKEKEKKLLERSLQIAQKKADEALKRERLQKEEIKKVEKERERIKKELEDERQQNEQRIAWQERMMKKDKERLEKNMARQASRAQRELDSLKRELDIARKDKEYPFTNEKEAIDNGTKAGSIDNVGTLLVSTEHELQQESQQELEKMRLELERQSSEAQTIISAQQTALGEQRAENITHKATLEKKERSEEPTPASENSENLSKLEDLKELYELKLQQEKIAQEHDRIETLNAQKKEIQTLKAQHNLQLKLMGTSAAQQMHATEVSAPSAQKDIALPREDSSNALLVKEMEKREHVLKRSLQSHIDDHNNALLKAREDYAEERSVLEEQQRKLRVEFEAEAKMREERYRKDMDEEKRKLRSKLEAGAKMQEEYQKKLDEEYQKKLEEQQSKLRRELEQEAQKKITEELVQKQEEISRQTTGLIESEKESLRELKKLQNKLREFEEMKAEETENLEKAGEERMRQLNCSEAEKKEKLQSALAELEEEPDNDQNEAQTLRLMEDLENIRREQEAERQSRRTAEYAAQKKLEEESAAMKYQIQQMKELFEKQQLQKKAEDEKKRKEDEVKWKEERRKLDEDRIKADIELQLKSEAVEQRLEEMRKSQAAADNLLKAERAMQEKRLRDRQEEESRKLEEKERTLQQKEKETMAKIKEMEENVRRRIVQELNAKEIVQQPSSLENSNKSSSAITREMNPTLEAQSNSTKKELEEMKKTLILQREKEENVKLLLDAEKLDAAKAREELKVAELKLQNEMKREVEALKRQMEIRAVENAEEKKRIEDRLLAEVKVREDRAKRQREEMHVAMAERDAERQAHLDAVEQKFRDKVAEETKVMKSRFEVAVHLGKLQKQEDLLAKAGRGGRRVSLREKILAEKQKQNAAKESLAVLKAEAKKEAAERLLMEKEEKDRLDAAKKAKASKAARDRAKKARQRKVKAMESKIRRLKMPRVPTERMHAKVTQIAKWYKHNQSKRRIRSWLATRRYSVTTIARVFRGFQGRKLARHAEEDRRIRLERQRRIEEFEAAEKLREQQEDKEATERRQRAEERHKIRKMRKKIKDEIRRQEQEKAKKYVMRSVRKKISQQMHTTGDAVDKEETDLHTTTEDEQNSSETVSSAQDTDELPSNNITGETPSRHTEVSAAEMNSQKLKQNKMGGARRNKSRSKYAVSISPATSGKKRNLDNTDMQKGKKTASKYLLEEKDFDYSYSAAALKVPATLPLLQSVHQMNTVAADLIKRGSVDEANAILVGAERMTNNILPGDFEREYLSTRATTLMRLATTLNREKDHESALSFLEEAVLLKRTPAIMNNLCSTYSAMGQHENALNWALDAVEAAEKVEMPEALPVALHNLGIEYEALQEHETAMSNFGRALRLATDRFGISSPLTASIRTSLRSARASRTRETNVSNPRRDAPIFQMPTPIRR